MPILSLKTGAPKQLRFLFLARAAIAVGAPDDFAALGSFVSFTHVGCVLFYILLKGLQI